MIIKSADPGRNNDSVEPIFVRLRAISSGEYYVRNAPQYRSSRRKRLILKAADLQVTAPTLPLECSALGRITRKVEVFNRLNCFNSSCDILLRKPMLARPRQDEIPIPRIRL